METLQPAARACAPTSLVKKSKVNTIRINEPQDLDRDGQCHTFLPAKNRWCRLEAKKGTKYCGEHRIFDKEGHVKRVLCPFKCNSTFGVWEVERHIKDNCPFRPKVDQPFYSLNINDKNGFSVENEKLDSGNSRMEYSEFQNAHEAIQTVWKRLTELGLTTFPKQCKAHPFMTEFVEQCVTGKHSKQNSSLLAHLDDLGFLDDNANQRCFQEWGCGKAELSKWIAKELESRGQKAASYVLIDRKQGKLKMDHVFKENNNYQRVLIDIKDLSLAKVPGVADFPSIAYSKHLCGSATDLTLRALSNFTLKDGGQLDGLFIALCCHQVCTFSRYINPEFLQDYGIADATLFKTICKISTWAICGRPKDQQLDGDDCGKHWTGLQFQEREQLGWRAKRILDIGRMLYIKQNMKATDVGLIQYIEKESTLENLALWAKFK